MERFNKTYNLETIDNFIIQNKEMLEREIYYTLHINDIELSINKINKFIRDMHHCSQQPRTIQVPNNSNAMKTANKTFNEYCDCLRNSNQDEINQKLNGYQLARKTVTNLVLRNENGKWFKNINNKNPKAIWTCINWKGCLDNNKMDIYPPINELKAHFQDIYTPEDPLEIVKIEELFSETYIPVHDDPIKKYRKLYLIVKKAVTMFHY